MEGTLVHPVVTPVSNGLEISTGIWACRKESFDVRHLSKNKVNSLDDHAVILSSKVVNSSADGLFESISVLESAFEVGLPIITSETSDKTGKEIGDLNGVEGEAAAVGSSSKWVAHLNVW